MAAAAAMKAARWLIPTGAIPCLLGAVLIAGALRPLSAGSPLSLSPADGLLLATGAALIALGTLLWAPGLAIYVLIPSFSGPAAARQDHGSHRVVLACTLLATVGGNLLAGGYLIAAALLAPSSPGRSSLLSGGPPSPTELAVAAVSLDLALLAIVYLRIIRPGAVPWSAMGLSLHSLGGRVLLGLLFGLLLFVVGTALEFLLGRLGVQQTQSAIFQSVTRASPGEFGLLLLAGAVLAPAVEEIYFRGYVFRAYLERKGTRRAFLYSAGLFAAVHLNLPAFLPIFAMGLLLALVYFRTGSLVPSIVAHMMNNAVAFTLMYLGVT